VYVYCAGRREATAHIADAYVPACCGVAAHNPDAVKVVRYHAERNILLRPNAVVGGIDT
jgi:hypothetical protein